jgi:hypothetical protein
VGHHIGILVDDLPDRGPYATPSGKKTDILQVVLIADKVFIVELGIEADLVIIAERLQLDA